MVTETLTVRDPDSVKTVLVLHRKDGAVSVELAFSDELRAEIERTIRDGLVEWSEEGCSTIKADDPDFLTRLGKNLERQFRFRIELVGQVPAPADLAKRLPSKVGAAYLQLASVDMSKPETLTRNYTEAARLFREEASLRQKSGQHIRVSKALRALARKTLGTASTNYPQHTFLSMLDPKDIDAGPLVLSAEQLLLCATTCEQCLYVAEVDG